MPEFHLHPVLLGTSPGWTNVTLEIFKGRKVSEVSGVADGRCVFSGGFRWLVGSGRVMDWSKLGFGSSHLEAFMLFQNVTDMLHYASTTSKLFQLERGSTFKNCWWWRSSWAKLLSWFSAAKVWFILYINIYIYIYIRSTPHPGCQSPPGLLHF